MLAGAGDKAFCTGGDQSAHDGNYDGRGTIGLPMEELHTAIRDVPKPVIARVQGFAIGGGNVLCTICDLTIAREKAIFGQVGPKMGSVDPGYGTAFLARVVGEKKAREIWYLCRRYSAPGGGGDGPGQRLRAARAARRRGAAVGAEIMASAARPRSPSPSAASTWTPRTSAASPGMGMYALKLYYDTEESREGVNALKDKRKPDFRKFTR